MVCHLDTLNQTAKSFRFERISLSSLFKKFAQCILCIEIVKLSSIQCRKCIAPLVEGHGGLNSSEGPFSRVLPRRSVHRRWKLKADNRKCFDSYFNLFRLKIACRIMMDSMFFSEFRHFRLFKIFDYFDIFSKLSIENIGNIE